MTDTMYVGKADFQSCEYEVHIWNGKENLPLPPRNDLRDHSPSGVSWGYAGSGPAQLALALLADATGKDAVALRYYQQFKAQVVSAMPENWTMEISSIRNWVSHQQAEEERSNA